MAIPEEQLEIWSHQGSVAQSAATYETIRGVLQSPKAPYSDKSFTVFLQGSYGNDTNVFRDSDVDIVVRLNDAFRYDVDDLQEQERTAFDRAYANVEYGHSQFRADVLSWLRTNYGDDVVPGSKAITIKARNNRREADVLPCLSYRRYTRFSKIGDEHYYEGICFFRTDGVLIVNFPKQHSENCTTKHQQTGSRFKPMVRVLKNMRNRMVDGSVIGEGLAPSYFLEGMLWNVPDSSFAPSYGATMVNCIKWLQQSNKSQLVCASHLHWLLRDNQPVCWNEKDFAEFMGQAVRFWNEW